MKIHQEYEVQEFNRLYKELDELYHETALKRGISDSAFTIMYVVCVLGDGCLQKDVCREAYISKQTIHSSVRNLERRGYLYLEKGNGRDKHIRLTEAGRKFIDERIRPIVEAENRAFQEMSGEERSLFIRLSGKYVENFERLLKEENLVEDRS